MTEKEKMIQGLPYYPSDPGLEKARLSARKLCRAIAEIPMEAEEERKVLFRELLGNTKDTFYLENPFICDYGFNIHLGENAYANFGCIILDAAPVHIGANTMLAPRVSIFTATHPLDYQTRNTGLEFAKAVHIGGNVWIGGDVTINPGVTIGDNSVIGSGSVVVKDIPANVVAVGNPCRVLKPIEQKG